MVFLEKIMRYMNALLVLIYKYLKNERKEASKMKKISVCGGYLVQH